MGTIIMMDTSNSAASFLCIASNCSLEVSLKLRYREQIRQTPTLWEIKSEIFAQFRLIEIKEVVNTVNTWECMLQITTKFDMFSHLMTVALTGASVGSFPSDAGTG
jgi:hypothetical protein